MKIKEGVDMRGVKAEMTPVYTIVNDIYKSYGQEPVITSGCEGKHGKASLHYSGLALDFRTRYFDRLVADKLTNEIRSRLGEQFDVILEKDHLHIEFQPK